MIIRLPAPRPPQQGKRPLTRQETDALWERGTVSYYGKQLPARRLRRDARTVAMLHKGTWKVAGGRPRATFRAAPVSALQASEQERR